MEKNVVITIPTTQSAKTTTATPTTDVVDVEIELKMLTTWIHEFQNPKFRIFTKFLTNQILLDKNQIKRQDCL